MNHIRDIGEAEWLRYIEQRSLTIHDLLVREYADWHAPDKQYLQLTGWTALTYWQWIHKRATSPQVWANAIAEIRKIETTVLKVCGTKDRVVCVCRFFELALLTHQVLQSDVIRGHLTSEGICSIVDR